MKIFVIPSAAMALAFLMPASPSQAQKVKPAPLSLEASQSNDLPSQLGGSVMAPALGANPYQVAPMPNSDLNAPLPPTPKTAELAPNVFQPRKQFRGDGYSYGSTAQSWQEQRLKPAPGVSLTVPLQ